MVEKIFGKSGGAGLESVLASIQEFSRLNLSVAEKLANFQLESLRSYADLGFSELRAVIGIRDSKSLKEFVGGRAKVAEALGKRLQDDAKTLTEIGSDYSAEAQKLLRASLPGAAGKTAPAA